MAEQEQRTHRGPRRDRGRDMEPQEKQFDERVINIDRVARVMGGGRRFRFRALVVVGDKKNKIGIGVAKGADVTAAVSKATNVAKKNFMTIPIEKGTISHDVQAKVGGAVILIKPAPAGSGLIAGGTVRTILEVGGVHNAVSKSLGSSNKINTAYATLDALRQLKPSKEWRKAPAKTVKTVKKAEVVATEKVAKETPKKAVKTVKKEGSK